MDERKLYKDNDTKKRNQINTMVKKQCQEAKEAWLEKICRNLEINLKI